MSTPVCKCARVCMFLRVSTSCACQGVRTFVVAATKERKAKGPCATYEHYSMRDDQDHHHEAAAADILSCVITFRKSTCATCRP